MALVLDVSAGVNNKSGLGRYSRSLTKALLPLLDEPPVLFYNRIKGRTEPIAGLENLPTHSLGAGYKPWRMAVWMGQLMGLSFKRLVPETTLFHGMEHLLMPVKGVPSVLTVHDLIFKLFPEYHKRLNHIYLNQAMPLFVEKANAIIAISESSKRDIVEHYGTSPEKIHVIYEAPYEDFKRPTPDQIADVRKRYQLPEQFLLVVGTIEPRKNYSRLVQALMRLRQTHRELHLVVVGSKGWLFDEFFQTIEDEKAAEYVIFPGYVPDADLPAVYGAATVTVMPSVYEGFGLPILEAMACGSPVACSNASSLPELGSDIARYFDPLVVDDMVASIDLLLNDTLLRADLAKRGLEHVTQFSWDRNAHETLHVYNSLVDKPFGKV